MGDEVPRPWEVKPRPGWAERWHQWRDDRRIAAAMLACIAVAAAAAWVRSGSSSQVSLPAPAPTSVSAGPNTTAVSTTVPAGAIVVDVVGAVRHNGVVRLHTGARVVDAIAAAGGAAPGADLTRLNLAAVLADGTRVAVPVAGAAAPGVDPAAVSGSASPAGDATGGAPTAEAPVNLNTANAAQLEALPGVGPATATAIVTDRTDRGPFRSVNDLGRVRGIGDAKLAQLRPLVTV